MFYVAKAGKKRKEEVVSLSQETEEEFKASPTVTAIQIPGNRETEWGGGVST